MYFMYFSLGRGAAQRNCTPAAITDNEGAARGEAEGTAPGRLQCVEHRGFGFWAPLWMRCRGGGVGQGRTMNNERWEVRVRASFGRTLCCLFVCTACCLFERILCCLYILYVAYSACLGVPFPQCKGDIPIELQQAPPSGYSLHCESTPSLPGIPYPTRSYGTPRKRLHSTIDPSYKREKSFAPPLLVVYSIAIAIIYTQVLSHTATRVVATLPYINRLIPHFSLQRSPLFFLALNFLRIALYL